MKGEVVSEDYTLQGMDKDSGEWVNVTWSAVNTSVSKCREELTNSLGMYFQYFSRFRIIKTKVTTFEEHPDENN